MADIDPRIRALYYIHLFCGLNAITSKNSKFTKSKDVDAWEAMMEVVIKKHGYIFNDYQIAQAIVQELIDE